MSTAPSLPITAARAAPVVPALLFLAAFVPCVLAVEYGPVIGQLQEQLSYGLWALCMVALAWQPRRDVRLQRSTLALAALLGVLAVLALVQCAVMLQVPHRGLLSFFYLMAAAGLVLSGALAADTVGPSAVRWLLAGLLAAGLVNAGIAVVQVTHPAWADDVWIAQGFAAGRANGNLRQPNQLAVLLVTALVALWALRAQWPAGNARATLVTGALAVPLLLGVVLSASRFGLLCALLVIAHGLVFPWTATLRRLALGALLTLGLIWLLATVAPLAGGTGLALNERLAHETASGSRWPLWHAALQLLQAHPWFGVGWGEFNRAWMLTPKTLLTTHSFSNAHNLPLHWAIELGLPLALLCCAVVLRCAWRLWRRVPAGTAEAPLRTAIALIATVLLLYSLIEFPLWFSRFLFPLCFLVGWAGCSAGGVRLRLPAWKALTAGALLAVLAAHADYRSTAGLRDVRGLDAQQIEDRVAQGRRSFLYASTAFRATALNMQRDAMASAAVAYAGQDFLDLKLLAIWAQALDAAGDHARAQYLLDRMAEMGTPAQPSPGGCAADAAGMAACRARAAALRLADFR